MISRSSRYPAITLFKKLYFMIPRVYLCGQCDGIDAAYSAGLTAVAEICSGPFLSVDS